MEVVLRSLHRGSHHTTMTGVVFINPNICSVLIQ